MQFSLDHKRRSHKQNQCSASDSVSLILTRLYCSTLLIMILTTTPSLVKISLNNISYIITNDGSTAKKNMSQETKIREAGEKGMKRGSSDPNAIP